MSESARGPAGAGPSRRLVDALVAIALALLGAVVMWDSRRIGAGWASDGPQAGYFPFYIGLLMTGGSLVNLYRALRTPAGEVFVPNDKLGLVLAVLTPTIVFVVLIPWLGIYVPAALFIAFFMRWLGDYSWAGLIPVALTVPVAFFVMFEHWFLVPLPKGPVEALFGL